MSLIITASKSKDFTGFTFGTYLDCSEVSGIPKEQFRICLPHPAPGRLKKHIRKPRPLGGTLRTLFTQWQWPITHGNMAKTENNPSDLFLMGGVGS